MPRTVGGPASALANAAVGLSRLFAVDPRPRVPLPGLMRRHSGYTVLDVPVETLYNRLAPSLVGGPRLTRAPLRPEVVLELAKARPAPLPVPAQVVLCTSPAPAGPVPPAPVGKESLRRPLLLSPALRKAVKEQLVLIPSSGL